MSGTIAERFEEMKEALEKVEGRPFLSLLVLDSKMRYGLAEQDGKMSWARVFDGVLLLFEPKVAMRFVELCEQDRDELEDRIAAAADKLGLDGREVADSLPAVELVAALLAGRVPMICRTALSWVLPTELRALRDAVSPLATDRSLPQDVRDRAARMTVRD